MGRWHEQNGFAADLGYEDEMGLRHGSKEWVNGLVRQSGSATWEFDIEIWVGRWR